MAAGTLNCPMCGASVKTEATKCEHCGTRLATVACPSCFGMIFVGAKFCSHCGARADLAEATSSARLCPRCGIRLKAINLGGADLLECPKCDGIWADSTALDQICSDRDKQAAVLGSASTIPASLTGQIEKNIRYVPCPVCQKLMNRVNFARCSQVVVDVCRGHGTWFDPDELRRIVEFIKNGGLEVAREKEIRQLEERRRQLQSEQVTSAWSGAGPRGADYGDLHLGIFSAARVIRDLFR